jgi:hypothetical protein
VQIKRGSVGRTGLLAAIAVAAILVQLFPDHVGAIKWAVILLGLAYLLAQALTTYPKLYLDRRRLEVQSAADEQEYGTYERELAALRSRYPAERLADGAVPPPEYQAELAALNERHREMLTRKFGAY